MRHKHHDRRAEFKIQLAYRFKKRIGMEEHMKGLQLWYQEPASKWTEALPLGNGRIGAMVYGGTTEDLLCLNEDSLWSGYPRTYRNEGAHEYVKRAASLAKEGKYVEAEACLSEGALGPYSQAYMPMGNLHIRMNHGGVTDYQRNLNLKEAVHTSSYRADGALFQKEVFVSHPDQVLVYRIVSNQKESIRCEISFTSLLKVEVRSDKEGIQIEGICPSEAKPNYLNYENPISYYEEEKRRGIRFHSMVKLKTVGGTTSFSEGKVWVEAAEEVCIYLSVRSNFAGFDQYPELAGKSYIEPSREEIERAMKLDYTSLKERHVEDYSKYYQRVSFYLGEDRRVNIPMNQRLREFQLGQEDPCLPIYLFQYGRYLLLASSRIGTQATNLQGIWNHSLLPPWSSNYTININTQMNYWPVFIANLSECGEPLVDLIRDLSIAGEQTARDYYDASGFVSHHNTDLWRLTNPVGEEVRNSSVVFAFWGLSSGWLCQHLYEKYEYTKDLEFLKNTAYPIMKKAATFYLETLEIDAQGHYVMTPSTSPENEFIVEGRNCSVARTSTITMSIIKELFGNCKKAANILGIDGGFTKHIEEILGKLYPFQVGNDGRLLEWSEEFEEADKLHRHISHLYALHPARLITPLENPVLAEACRKVLEIKGTTGTGWSLSWKVNQWARLLDGEEAYKLVKQQLHLVEAKEDAIVMGDGGTYPNLLDAHPPFQIDGNFGILSGIAEMLVQSYEEKLFILPAIPKDWEEGEVRGLKTKQGITVGIAWKKDRSITLELQFSYPNKICLYHQEEVYQVEGKKEEKICMQLTRR